LSRLFLKFVGNETIDRYPLPYEGRLTKILCITKEIFKKLKTALKKFGLEPKSTLHKPKTSFRQKISKRKPLGAPRNNEHELDGDKCIASFEPTNIFNTRNSSFWRMKRLEAWFKEQESYEDPRYLEYYSPIKRGTY